MGTNRKELHLGTVQLWVLFTCWTNKKTGLQSYIWWCWKENPYIHLAVQGLTIYRTGCKSNITWILIIIYRSIILYIHIFVFLAWIGQRREMWSASLDLSTSIKQKGAPTESGTLLIVSVAYVDCLVSVCAPDSMFIMCSWLCYENSTLRLTLLESHTLRFRGTCR